MSSVGKLQKPCLMWLPHYKPSMEMSNPQVVTNHGTRVPSVGYVNFPAPQWCDQ